MADDTKRKPVRRPANAGAKQAAAPVKAAEPAASPEITPPPAVEAPAPVPVAEAEVETPTTSTAFEAAVEQEGMKMVDVIESTKKFADDAKVQFESAFSELSEKTKAGVEKSTKAFEELSALTKGNVEALVESSKIAVKGVEGLGQSAAEFGRSNFEKTSAAMKSFASIKTPAEFFQLHSELVSGAFDEFAKETAKNSEALLKLAGDVVQPISSRVSLMTEKVKSFTL